MDSQEYKKLATKTEANDFNSIKERLNDDGMIRILHGAMGLNTEAGELMDALKKHIFYNKPLDKSNLFEELGDLFWYMALICDELGFDFETIMEKNIAKLKVRYGHKFSSEKAEHRDIAKERDAFEVH